MHPLPHSVPQLQSAIQCGNIDGILERGVGVGSGQTMSIFSSSVVSGTDSASGWLHGSVVLVKSLHF